MAVSLCFMGNNQFNKSAQAGHCSTFCLVLSVLVLCTASVSARAETITVFAAASLTTALSQIARDYEAGHDHEIVLSFAGSSALARQIQLGAPADIFISASPDWMDLLQAGDLIDPDSRRDLLGNELVLIAHGDAEAVDLSPDLDIGAMLGTGRLAMALTEAVPAGIYGRMALQSLGLWDDISQQVAETDNVRSALALVALGEAPLGVVYATDALAEPDVSVIASFPADSHPAITYPAAMLYGPAGEDAGDFMAFLSSTAAQDVFEAQGFTVLGD